MAGNPYVGGPWRAGTTQTVAFTGTAGTISNAVGSQTRVVRVYCTAAAFVLIDNAPTATTAAVPIAANTPEYFVCTPGQKVSAIQQSAGGNLHVTEMTR